MNQSSELEELLRAEIGEGVRDSSGTFTISREKALEKLAAFRLPRESAWVLKIVQAAVASSCTQLDIRQTSSATEFHFGGEVGWTLEQVEEEFYRVEDLSEPSLECLKQGLWSVSLNGMRPFCLLLPNRADSLFWTGDQMLRRSSRSQSSTILTVSHRSMVEGRSFSLLPNYEGASRNAEIARELAEHAFTCSKPLRLDKRRLDALQNSPRHGLSASTYPIEIGFLKADVPVFPLPPGTLKGFIPQDNVDASMKKILRSQVSLPSRLGVAALVTAHLRKTQQNKNVIWQTFTDQSIVYWVRDGVVVDRSPVKSTNCCSLALFASAEGLSADATGFELIKDSAFRSRLNEVCQCGANFLREVELDGSGVLAEAHLLARVLGGALILGGIGLSFASLPHGLVLAASGAVSIAGAGRKEQELLEHLQTGLRSLQKDWQAPDKRY
ncbi:MAG: hypothetical protein U0931_11925 [Vulcanimicrobiota bacterium]